LVMKETSIYAKILGSLLAVFGGVASYYQIKDYFQQRKKGEERRNIFLLEIEDFIKKVDDFLSSFIVGYNSQNAVPYYQYAVKYLMSSFEKGFIQTIPIPPNMKFAVLQWYFQEIIRDFISSEERKLGMVLFLTGMYCKRESDGELYSYLLQNLTIKGQTYNQNTPEGIYCRLAAVFPNGNESFDLNNFEQYLIQPSTDQLEKVILEVSPTQKLIRDLEEKKEDKRIINLYEQIRKFFFELEISEVDLRRLINKGNGFVFVLKWAEGREKTVKPLVKILSEIGFVMVQQGVYASSIEVVPDKWRNNLNVWLDKEIISKLSKKDNYRLIACRVDPTTMAFKIRKRKFPREFIQIVSKKIDISDMLKSILVRGYSLHRILNEAKMDFLITSLPKGEKSIIRKKMKSIESYLKKKGYEIRTVLDYENFHTDRGPLVNAIEKYSNLPRDVCEKLCDEIIDNSKFWVNYIRMN